MDKKKILLVSIWIIAFSLMTTWASKQIGTHIVGVDDSNIFFVYAKNLVHGDGFVFNHDGGHVEGFTSLSWVVVCALFYRILPSFEIYLIGFNLVWVALSSFILFSVVVNIVKENRKADTFGEIAIGIIFLAWMALSAPFIIWTNLSLMEVGWWTGLLILSIAYAIRYSVNERPHKLDRVLLSLLLFFLVITRPEGLIWVPVLILSSFSMRLFITKNRTLAWQHVRYLLVVFLTTAGGLTIFRLLYFGYPLPNTYYAKVSPDYLYNIQMGTQYLLQFLTSDISLILALVVDVLLIPACIIRIYKSKAEGIGGPEVKTSMAILVTIGFILTGLVVPVLNGGDHFAMFRFYQPIWPLFLIPPITYILSLEVGSRLLQNRSFLIISTLLMIIGLYSSKNPTFSKIYTAENIIREFTITQNGREKGDLMNRLFSSSSQGLPSIGEFTVGGVAYEYQGNVIDLMGLNYVAMAHSPGDRKGKKNHASFDIEVFFENPPPIILPRITRKSQIPPDMIHCDQSFLEQAFKGLLCDQRFISLYAPIVTKLEYPQSDYYFFAFVQKNQIDAYFPNRAILLFR